MTDKQPTAVDIALTFTPLVPGTVSILGASAILYNILSDPDRRFTTPYFRIMVSLSAADIPYAVAKMFSTFPAPKNSPGLYFASGNQATCNLQGFFLHLGMIQPLYVASLSIYYLMVIKYSKSDKYLSKNLEPWMHAISLGYPLIGAIVALSMEYFNYSPNQCWIQSYPLKCEGDTCIRGKHAYLLGWILAGGVICFTVIVVSFCMIQVVLFVRRRLVVVQRKFTFANRTISNCRNLEKQYKAATRQALLYVGTFLLVWFFGFLFRVSKKTRRNVYLLLPAQVLNPLQGFFNFLIYIWPRYVKSKEEFKDKSFFWLMYDSIVTPIKTKAARRRSFNVKIRVMKKRKSALLKQEDVEAGHRNFSEGQSYSKEGAKKIGVIENLNLPDEDEEPLTILQTLQRMGDLEEIDFTDSFNIEQEIGVEETFPCIEEEPINVLQNFQSINDLPGNLHG